ncbi:uncharacterized protein LOC119335838 [Triticum dicoccoides]|uniref:uncharacterized protein LOC119335838 n=1 Tax=Triticum dicoccoides TaxID=85692 RepID=UPI00189194BA|nr:uncharacterized protein LOC119335838 [Triticum dicoccoides]
MRKLQPLSTCSLSPSLDRLEVAPPTGELGQGLRRCIDEQADSSSRSALPFPLPTEHIGLFGLVLSIQYREAPCLPSACCKKVELLLNRVTSLCLILGERCRGQ